MSSQSGANGHNDGTEDEITNLSPESAESSPDHKKQGVEYNPFGGVNIDLARFPESAETKGF